MHSGVLKIVKKLKLIKLFQNADYFALAFGLGMCAPCIHNKYSEHEEVRIYCMNFKYVLSND